MQNGTQIRFWEDIWLGHRPLKEQYPILYNIVMNKNTTVETMVGVEPLNVYFQRALVGNKLEAWHEVVVKVMNVQLSDE